jgi:hypothetical protein
MFEIDAIDAARNAAITYFRAIGHPIGTRVVGTRFLGDVVIVVISTEIVCSPYCETFRVDRSLDVEIFNRAGSSWEPVL